MKNKIIITEETAAVLNFYGLTFSRGHSISPIYLFSEISFRDNESSFLRHLPSFVA